jgi:hypothetical protein
MLTNEQIELNKQEFLTLIQSIKREGANIESLVNKLCSSDFFVAPASTKYHCNYAGGLCEHSLNVYHNLDRLVSNQKGLDECCYDDDTLKIVALLHDVSKMNIYEQTAKNEKVYCEDGDKYDAIGRFRWETTLGWKTKENKFVYGSHEETSEFIARQFIPLTLDESVAILHHMGSLGWDSAQDNIASVYSHYSLSLILHMADMISTYVDERQV